MIELRRKISNAKAWLVKHKTCTGGGFVAGLILGVLL